MAGEGRKVQVVITERRRERSSWIRFGEERAIILLKGVESFRKEADLDGKRHRLLDGKRSDKWVDFVRRIPASYGN